MLRKAAGVEKGSGDAKVEQVGTVSLDQVREIAETKMPEPERRRYRGRDSHRRGDGAQHGHSGRALERVLTWPRTENGTGPAAEMIEEGRAYPVEEAVSLAKKSATAKFDETVELHLRTGSDPRHAEQQVRGVTVLPHGTGKAVRVLVFAEGETASIAREAGADFIGDDEVIKQIQGGWVDFDVSIATPDMMPKVGRLGRVLGRRGLMPNPRTGTVVQPEDVRGPSRTPRRAGWNSAWTRPP